MGQHFFSEQSDINDLSGLQNLHSVEGLSISKTDLQNLNGLQNLNAAEGLRISQNDVLTNIDALQGVSNSYQIYIQVNTALLNINGLQGLNSTISSLRIVGNPLITNLNGLQNAPLINTYLEITSNEALTDFCGISGVLGDFTESFSYFLFGNAYNPDLRNEVPCSFSEPEEEPQELPLMPKKGLFLFAVGMVAVILTQGKRFF